VELTAVLPRGGSGITPVGWWREGRHRHTCTTNTNNVFVCFGEAGNRDMKATVEVHCMHGGDEQQLRRAIAWDGTVEH
jgi:hypothetical protein